jgi:serine phosphatase RsbU (regulator of sigma subunit)
VLADAISAAVAGWRARATRVILVVVALAGLPAWGSVIWSGLRAGEMSVLLWIYVVVYVAIMGLAFLPFIDHRMRVWGLLILGYANGVASLARLGLAGSGRLYLFALPIFATVLVGRRAGLAAMLLSLATYVVFTAEMGTTAAQPWIEAGLALAVFAITTVVLLGRFNRFQLQTLRREQQARVALEEAQAELEAYSRTLEQKVVERTARLAEAKQVAEAASQRFEQELQFAGRIQASFMASELPEIPSWESAAALVPARETSGDFYDVFPLPRDSYGILIADVVDKGVGAALFMALNWALLHTYARQYPDEPARVLAATNRRILRDTHAGQFVTVFYGTLNAGTGTLLYANAGHPPPCRFRDGKLSALARTGIPLGILEDEQWQQETVRFQPGDVCLLYTDGITEAENRQGEFYGVERLASALRRGAGRPARAIREALLDDVNRFVGSSAPGDDITLLVLKQTGATAQPAGE